MADKIFVKGLLFKRPEQGTPEWIKGKLAINPDILLKFAEEHKLHKSEKGWLNVDLKASKEGVLYLELNTWKAKKENNEFQDLRDSHNESITRNKESEVTADEVAF